MSSRSAFPLLASLLIIGCSASTDGFDASAPTADSGTLDAAAAPDAMASPDATPNPDAAPVDATPSPDAATFADATPSPDAAPFPDAAAPDAEAPDASAPDAEAPDAAEPPDAGGCGLLGTGCPAAGCGAGLTCINSFCMPENRGDCGGFANHMCPAATPVCRYYAMADFGTCLIEPERACICALPLRPITCP